jgi:hypothetical protein
MAYVNLQPTLFAEEINRDLERLLVFADGTDRRYEGLVSKQGDEVKIPAIGRPTISTVTMANRNADISDAEILESTATYLKIDQLKSFNYYIGDIDQQFAIDGMKEGYKKETVQGLANEIDIFIAKMAQSADAVLLQSSSVIPLVSQSTSAGILNQIDAAIQKLWEQDVPFNEELELIITPRAYMILKQAYVNIDTNNSGMLEHGKVGKYGNVSVKVSNNVATLNDAGATDLCMLRTKRSISYVHPLTHLEPYRPEKKFADALKGFILFGGTIVRPKELVVINWKYA